MDKLGVWLLRSLTVFCFATSIAALLLPKFWTHQISGNDSSASTALKTLSSAEADYRANDRDHNGVNDFWTGDVAGLAPLIERRIAEADGAPLNRMAPVARDGYYYQVLHRDRYVSEDYQ